jgi:TonB family protein
MPNLVGEISHESTVFEFTVDSKGSVKDIHSIYGSESAANLLTPYLATWKFQPALKNNRPVEVTGRVRFLKGQGDDAAKLRLTPPLMQSRPPEPARTPETSAPPVTASKIHTAVNAKDGQRYVWIPPGSFTMGCSQGDTECSGDETPPHVERIANGFWLGQTEVTQAAYLRVTGGNPSAHKGDQLPVESLTWNHAANYCRAIDARLPTEIEWEYAARAGSPWARYGNLDEVAWHSGNSGGATHLVATKQPNAFGLYDMLGNLWEYVADSSPGSSDKILRGGSLLVDIRNTRASSRMKRPPSDSANGRGFRCAGDGPGTEPGSKAGATSSESAKPAGAPAPHGNANAAPRMVTSLALYRFRDDGSDALGLSGPFSLANTAFRDGSLYLKGVYESSRNNDMYPATPMVPKLDYLNFTVALDFNAEAFDPRKSVILYGGTAYRWWGLGWRDGVLELALNNGNYRHAFDGAALSSGAWHNVICSVDLPAGLIRTVLDGRALPDVQLPQGFRLEVVGSEYEGRDKRFTFANYSNGTLFQGYVNNLRIYGDSLSGSELQAIYRLIGKDTPGPIRAGSPTLTAVREPMVNKRDGQRYVWVPPGAFTMGCSAGDTQCNDNEKASHPEQIAEGFWLGETEVTQAAYRRVTGRDPSHNKGDQLPVESVTWNDANQYCGMIGGHLPTEAEWEYAARGHAGITPARYGDVDAVAWHSGNGGGTIHAVAQKRPNAFGLYDMLGNVWEWVEDSHTGDSIQRGGSSVFSPQDARASRRSVVAPSASTPSTGFRCAGEWPVSEQSSPVGSAGTPLQATGPGGQPVNGVYRIGNGVSAPVLLRKVEPEYSEEARQNKYQGNVLLYIQVDPSGNAINVRVLNSLGLGLDEKAIEAVKKWKFRPGYKDGTPVTVESQVEINFRLL